MSDVKIDIAEDQERGTDRVMVSGGEDKEGIVLKDTIVGGLIEACRRSAEVTYSGYGSVVIGKKLLPMLREYLGVPAVVEDDDK